jgi:hypothetical protein
MNVASTPAKIPEIYPYSEFLTQVSMFFRIYCRIRASSVSFLIMWSWYRACLGKFHCQKISGREGSPCNVTGFAVMGTRETDRTGYFRVFRLTPVKIMLESISIGLKRMRVAIMVLWLNQEKR